MTLTLTLVLTLVLVLPLVIALVMALVLALVLVMVMAHTLIQFFVVNNYRMSKLVLINGTLYDVSDFKHPGGTVINSSLWTQSNPVDATIAFQQFHGHNWQKAEAYLKTLPIVPCPDRAMHPVDPVAEDFKKLYTELKHEGYFEPDIRHTTMRIIRDIGLSFLGFYLLLTATTWMSIRFFIGFALYSMSVMMLGWLEHEAGHHSIIKNNRLSRIFHKIVFDWLLGGSADFWNYQHNWHHSSTQHIANDIDLRTFPLLAFHEDIDDSAYKKVPFFIRYQHITWFWLNNSVVYALWKFIIHFRYAIRKKQYMYFVSLVLSISIEVYIMTLYGYSLLSALLLYLLLKTVGIDLLLMVFTISHTTQPVHHGENISWVDMASLYTVNVRPNILVNYWMGYLNFQIEHHLFPQMPQFKHPLIAHRVKQFFKKHNLPYNEKGYFEGLWDVFVNLYNVRNKLIEKEQMYLKTESKIYL